jgi:hypothetical protein
MAVKVHNKSSSIYHSYGFIVAAFNQSRIYIVRYRKAATSFPYMSGEFTIFRSKSNSMFRKTNIDSNTLVRENSHSTVMVWAYPDIEVSRTTIPASVTAVAPLKTRWHRGRPERVER